MTNKLYEIILDEIKTIQNVRVVRHGIVEEDYKSNGCNTNLAEIVVDFDTRRKKNWRGLLLREREPVIDIWDIRRRIRYKFNYSLTKANNVRLEYQEKKEYDGQKLLDKVFISITPLFISDEAFHKT